MTKIQKCTAKSKRSGKRCRNWPIRERKTCRMHNGNAKRGFENANTKHGMFSPHAGFLADKYNEFRNDEKLHSLRDHIAITDALIASHVEKLETHERSIEWYKELRRHVRGAWYADGSLTENAAEHIHAIRRLVIDGESIFTVKEELIKLMDASRRLKESDMKTIMAAKLYVPIDEFSWLVTRFMRRMTKYLDADEAKSLLGEFQSDILGVKSVRPEA